MIRNSGCEPRVIEYLQSPPERARLLELIAASGLSVREVMRSTEALFDELGLGDPSKDDEALIDAMLAHPVLINRPIVVTPLGTRPCRPSEVVLDILPQPQQGAFVKGKRGSRRRCGGAVVSEAIDDLPNVHAELFRAPDAARMRPAAAFTHPPRFLLL